MPQSGEGATVAGDFVGTGASLFRLYHGGATLPAEELCRAVALGQERTMEQDPTFAFRIIVDIASKGLSPAINDSTTAVLAIDQIHKLAKGDCRLQSAEECGRVRQHPPLLRHEPAPITLTVAKRIQHTTKAKLIVTPRAAEELKATMHEYTKACNYLAELAHRECLRRRYDLHHAAYADLRKQTRLPAQLCITAIAKVSEQLTREPRKLHRFKQLATIRYDERVMAFRDDFQTAALTVAPKGRVTGDLHMPAAMRRVLRESKIGSADLIFRGGEFYLHITTSREAPETDEPRGSLGVDLGVKRLAVTSDRQFVAAKSARHKKACFQKTRSGLQANGSKSAKRVLKRLSGRERRFMTDVNHQISKRIVAAAKARGQRIVLEDLTGIRGRANRGVVKHLHGWSFAQLRAFVEYKALAAGVEVVTVDPRYTSQACSRCLHLGTRPNQSSFRCGHCGLRLNADLNGARNVALRHDLVATGRYFCEVSQPAQSCRPRDEQQAVAF